MLTNDGRSMNLVDTLLRHAEEDFMNLCWFASSLYLILGRLYIPVVVPASKAGRPITMIHQSCAS